MRKLVVLGVLVGLLVLGDVAAKAFAESAVESGIGEKVEGVASVDAQIHSFPFTARLLGQGRVSELDLRLRDVTGHGIDIAWLRMQTEGLQLDRSVLYGGRVRVEDVDRVTVTASITEDEVRKATGADVQLLDGRAQLTIGGVTGTAAVTVADGAIRLTVGDLPALRVPVPDSDLLPCAVDARVVEGAILASCTAEDLPPIVLRAIGTVELRRG